MSPVPRTAALAAAALLLAGCTDAGGGGSGGGDRSGPEGRELVVPPEQAVASPMLREQSELAAAWIAPICPDGAEITESDELDETFVDHVGEPTAYVSCRVGSTPDDYTFVQAWIVPRKPHGTLVESHRIALGGGATAHRAWAMRVNGGWAAVTSSGMRVEALGYGTLAGDGFEELDFGG